MTEPLVFAEIADRHLRIEELIENVSVSSANGAVASFVGAVRDHHEGKRVVAVTYDAFKPLAEKVLAAIAAEAASKFKARVAVMHRVGRLELREASVAIAAASEHRAEAFDACRYVIEQIKIRLPVFKKEHYAEGKDAWLEGCALHK
jgi:molybdopterin synthase catalytic subunit